MGTYSIWQTVQVWPEASTGTSASPGASASLVGVTTPPDFTFQITTGRLFNAANNLVADGLWSGHGDGLNNPDMQSFRGVGPLPAGLYRIGPLENGGHLGPDVMALTQLSGLTYGRSGFFIHGANALHPLTSSDGCLIAQHSTRLTINSDCSAARVLAVIV